MTNFSLAQSYLIKATKRLSFYGDIDFIPTEEYSRKDAQRTIIDANTTVRVVRRVVKIP